MTDKGQVFVTPPPVSYTQTDVTSTEGTGDVVHLAEWIFISPAVLSPVSEYLSSANVPLSSGQQIPQSVMLKLIQDFRENDGVIVLKQKAGINETWGSVRSRACERFVATNYFH